MKDYCFRFLPMEYLEWLAENACGNTSSIHSCIY